MKRALSFLLVWAVAGAAVSAQQQSAKRRHSSASPRSKIYKLEELNWPQIDALERERTLVLLPVGMLEQHGPHLPVGADTLGVLYEVNGVLTRVSQALSDWNIVMLPPINYGHGGANQIGDMLVHPGTWHSAVHAEITCGGCWWTTCAERLQMDFRAERPLCSTPQYRYQRGM